MTPSSPSAPCISTTAEQWPGGHDLMGITTPSADWFFAEGYTGTGFDEWLCLQNPNGWTVEAEVYFTGPEVFESRTYYLPADSRTTVSVNGIIGAGLDVSLAIFTTDGDSNGYYDPIVAERPMYFDYGGAWTGGHISGGTACPTMSGTSRRATPGRGSRSGSACRTPTTPTSPSSSSPTCSATAATDSPGLYRAGPCPAPPSRSTTRWGRTGTSPSSATSDAPFIAERPMYFDYRGTVGRGARGHRGHRIPRSAGSSRKATPGRASRSGSACRTRLRTARLSRYGTCWRTARLSRRPYRQPFSRSTIYVNDVVGANKELSIEIISDVPVVAERPIYFLYQGWCPGGDNVMGYTPLIFVSLRLSWGASSRRLSPRGCRTPGDYVGELQAVELQVV